MVDRTIVIRAEGSNQLGMGHVMRCISLAQALKLESASKAIETEIIFATKPDDAVQNAIEHSDHIDSVAFFDPETSPDESLKDINENLNADIVVIDIDLRSIANVELKTLIPNALIVSLHEHNYPILKGDIVIAPTVRPLPSNPQGVVGKTHFIGADYVLLSSDILCRNCPIDDIGPYVKKGFVSMGGADPEQLTLAVSDAIASLGDSGIIWDIVIGPAVKFELTPLIENRPPFVRYLDGFHMNRNMFLDLLGSADVAITNGGTTLYESLALGTPTIAVPQNEFEAAVIEIIQLQDGCVGVLNGNSSEIKTAIEDLCSNYEKRSGFQETGLKLIDGKGSQRIARMLLSKL
jgi:UDP-2,4-diacetamido-2,4,6-trideoxy-beta-L-altropyranose hydrolase